MVIDKFFVYQKYPKTEHDLEMFGKYKERMSATDIRQFDLKDANKVMELADMILPICNDIEPEWETAPLLSRFGFMALHVDEEYQQNIFGPFCTTISNAVSDTLSLDNLQLRRLRTSIIEFALLGNAKAQHLIDRLNAEYGYDDELILPIVERRCIYLKRFLNAHDGNGRGVNDGDIVSSYQQALKEVKSGAKTSHWIWYIFPQMTGIKGTHSKPALFYGINGRLEAYQYINHPILRARLIEISQAIIDNEKTVYEIFGNDTMKVRACILLFTSVADIPELNKLKAMYKW